jgi:hypothetical protein
LRVGFFRRRDGVGEVGDEEEEEGGNDEGFVAVSEELKNQGLGVEVVRQERADGVCSIAEMESRVSLWKKKD